MNSPLSEILQPLLTKYNFYSDNPVRFSTRPSKNGASYLAWTNEKLSLAIFIYDDASIAVRDNNTSAGQVEFDLRVADPHSLVKLEAWMAEKVKKYASTWTTEKVKDAGI